MSYYDDDFSHPPEPISGRFGVQRYGLHGDLWRVTEIVTERGDYIHLDSAFATRDGAVASARKYASKEG